ncbi:uncharacterized protein UMAG_11445 [Mycosarcoma maydis]|uniref:Uncharacterized protein n=1 Tax=Mycosarcoma maydis TaxID=5270 RepID=A0A0D1CGR3_MYCMD|nr:uncharacterized protein UMAG_11445 [Ustilago maydis 521]KIS72122.1 hypothetical protein UMAG_11445 [Ustilago maydis 521]|eukprot:XP_011386772.1 hypothetical protein UMAG_11445 [Ustilago maydis 521]
MSSQHKLSKFKSAVAASSSSSSSGSRVSSPKAAIRSSSTTSTNISQANTLQALHQEQLARIGCITLPNLACAHSRRFIHLARLQAQGPDAMWSTQRVQAVQYRRSLWAEDVEPEAEARVKHDSGRRIVPDFYHKHNPRCARCALPLVPGLNQRMLSNPSTETKKRNKNIRTRSNKRVSCCSLCHHKTWSS